jgi:hypothetical protein
MGGGLPLPCRGNRASPSPVRALSGSCRPGRRLPQPTPGHGLNSRMTVLGAFRPLPFSWPRTGRPAAVSASQSPMHLPRDMPDVPRPSSRRWHGLGFNVDREADSVRHGRVGEVSGCTSVHHLHHNSIPVLRTRQPVRMRKTWSRARQGRGGGVGAVQTGLKAGPVALGLIVVHQQHASSQQSLAMVLADDLIPHREDVAVIGR